MANRIQLRRGTAAQWTAVNPVLAQGEPGVETDTGKQKFGDGVTVWAGLAYASIGPQGIPGVADDASVAGLVEDPESETATALSATIDDQITVDAAANKTVTGQRTFSSLNGLRSTTWFGLGAGVGADRMPFYQNNLLDGSTLSNDLAAGGGDDYVGHQINITFKGGFAALKTNLTASITSGQTTLTATTGTFTLPVNVGYTVVVTGAGAAGADLKAKIVSITDSTHAELSVSAGTTVASAAVIATLAADHNFIFGANDFFVTGTTAGDLSGIDHMFGRLMEVHLYTPNATLATLKAASSEAAIEASANGSTIATVIGHHVKSVANKSTATITNAYGLLIEGAATANATNSWALYVTAGKNRLGGATTIAPSVAAETPLTLQMPLNPTGQMFSGYDVTGTNRVVHITSSGAIGSNSAITAAEGLGAQVTIGAMTGGFAGVRMGSGTDAELRRTASGIIENSGKHKWVAANVQTTVGAAGAASTLPATPSKYLKVVGDDGSTYVVPAYAA